MPNHINLPWERPVQHESVHDSDDHLRRHIHSPWIVPLYDKYDYWKRWAHCIDFQLICRHVSGHILLHASPASHKGISIWHDHIVCRVLYTDFGRSDPEET